MGIAYRIRKAQDAPWSARLPQVKAIDRWERFTKQAGGPYRFGIVNDDYEDFHGWGPERRYIEARHRLPGRLDDLHIGDLLLTDTARGPHIAIRKVPAKTRVPDSSGTEQIDKIRVELFRMFSSLESWGICNCRPVAGSSTWSQHAWCNAEDVHGSFIAMGAAADWLVRSGKTRQLPVGQVIFNRRVWEYGDSESRPYTGLNPHLDHIHYTGHPHRGGTPPCAGG